MLFLSATASLTFRHVSVQGAGLVLVLESWPAALAPLLQARSRPVRHPPCPQASRRPLPCSPTHLGALRLLAPRCGLLWTERQAINCCLSTPPCRRAAAPLQPTCCVTFLLQLLLGCLTVFARCACCAGGHHPLLPQLHRHRGAAAAHGRPGGRREVQGAGVLSGAQTAAAAVPPEACPPHSPPLASLQVLGSDAVREAGDTAFTIVPRYQQMQQIRSILTREQGGLGGGERAGRVQRHVCR